MAIVNNTDKIAALYVSYFDRAPDPDGLSYWVGRANAGMSINDIAISFSQQPEAINAYAYLAAPNIGGAAAAQAFITTIYLNMFNHVPDTAGLNYWTAQLTGGAVKPALMIQAIIGGALGTDATILANKVTVGEAYADAFVAHNDQWTGVDNLASAKAALAGGSVFGADFAQVDQNASTVAGNIAKIIILAGLLHDNPGQVVINPNTGSITSGSDVDFVITGAHSLAGKTVAYAIGGAGTTASEIGVALNGSVTFDSDGKATLTVPTLVLATNLGLANDTMNLTINGQLSPNVTVIHGTQTVLPSGPTTVNEGSTFNVTVGTSLGAAAAGLVETYTVAGTGLAQIPVAERSGTVTLDSSGQFTVTLHTLATVFNSPNPDPTITITVNGVSTGTVTIHESAVQAITASDINEGQQATFNIATTGVNGAAVYGTVETWTLTGDAFVLSQLTGPTSGTVTLAADGTAAVSVGTTLTVFNIGGSNTGTLTFNLFNNNAPVVSQSITVTEATMEVTAPVDAVVEGTSVSFTVNTTDVPSGTQFHYHLSGSALGNIAPANQTGTFTTTGDSTVITLPTLANDPGGGFKSLTFTVDEVASATATATINEKMPFILTTGTDVFTGANGLLGGDPVENTFLAIATDAVGSTLGQNDVLTGGTVNATNLLSLTTQGSNTLNITSFQTNNIETFKINASNSSNNGTRIDMSSAFGVQTVIDENSSGTIQLLNVQNQITVDIRNPSDLNRSVDFGLQYVGGQLLNVNNNGQVINLDPTVSPITGMPNTIVNMPGVVNFTINSNGPANPNNSANFNGLAGLNQPLQNAGAPFNTANPLGSVAIVGASQANGGALGYVNGGFEVDQPGMVFTNTAYWGNNAFLSLSALNQVFYNVGDPDPATFVGLQAANTGTFFITGGAGDIDPAGSGAQIAMQSYYYNPFGNLGPQNGGSGAGTNFATILDTAGSIFIQIDEGSFWGQGVRDSSSGGSVTIQGINGAEGGFVDDVVNAATVKTNSGNVSISGLNGGLGSVNAQNPNGAATGGSFIITNTNAGNGGSVFIGGVNGGINERFSTGAANATISEGGNTGNIVLDFSQLALLGLAPGNQTGFHSGDSFTGGVDTNTLIVNPNYNNNTTGEGSASNVTNLILQSPSGLVWSPTAAPNVGGGTPTNSFGLSQLGNPTNVFIGGISDFANRPAGMLDANGNFLPVGLTGMNFTNATFTGAASTETFFVQTDSIPGGHLTGQIFGFDFSNGSSKTLNLKLQDSNGNQTLTVRDFSTSNGNNNPVTTFNFTSNTFGTAFLTIDTLNALAALNLAGNSNFVLTDTATQAASITSVVQTGNTNVDMRGLMTAASTNGAGYVNPGNGNADALSPNGGIIHLGTGTNQIAVGKGSWDILSNGANTTIVVNPTPGNTDEITALGGGVTITVGAVFAVAGQNGIVHIKTSNDTNLVIFDQSVLNLTSVDTVDMLNGAPAPGNDTVKIINGALNVNDSIFFGFKGVDNLSLAAGFNNALVLDVLANLNALSLGGGIFNINTGGSLMGLGSTVITGGPGYTSALQVHIASGGDLGGDTINMPTVTNGPLTVHAKVLDYQSSFETSLLTAQGTKEGVFANPAKANELKLTADLSTVVIDNLGSANAGTHGVQTITGVNAGNNVGMGVILPAAVVSTDVTTVDLSAVHGATFVLASGATQNLVLKGGGLGNQGNLNSGSDTLVAGSGNDTITAYSVWNNGGGVLTPKNFILGGLGSDTLTGVGGNHNTGTDFIYNTKLEISGDFITNFHGTADTLFLNPTIFTPGTSLSATAGGFSYVGSGQSYTDVLQLLVGGGTGAGNLTEAVYEIDTGMLWVDLDNNGLLNASDAQIRLDWASPPAIPGTQISLNVAEFNAQDGTSGLFYDGTKVIPALVFPNANPVNVAEWNWFQANGTVIGTGQTANFVGPGGTLTVSPNVSSYDFHLLTGGVNVTTPAFSGGTVMGPGTILGTTFDDKFFVNNADLTNGLLVNGDGGANDEITIDPPGPLVLTITSAMVQNVETLNLIDTLGNTISFGAGTGIKNINGSTGPDVINTLNMAAGGVIDLTNAVLDLDVVNLGSNVAPATIKAGGFTTVNMNYSGNGSPLTTAIIGKQNSEKLVLNDGNKDYDISGATITDIVTLDATQITNKTVTVAPEQIGGLNGFTNINLSGNVNETLKIGKAGTADFTNVLLNTTVFTLSEVADVHVKMHVVQQPVRIFGTGTTDTLEFVDAVGTNLLVGSGFYKNIGTVIFHDGLTIDNNDSNHGIVGLVGDGSSTLNVVGTSIDISGMTTFSGINLVNSALGGGKMLTVNSDQAIVVDDFHAAGLGNFNQNLTINSSHSYNVGSLQLSNDFFLGNAINSWKAVDLDGTDTGHITVTTTQRFWDTSLTKTAGGVPTIDTVHGDSVGTPTDVLIVNNNGDLTGTVDLSGIKFFDGFHDVHVNETFSDDIGDLFHVTDVISAYTNSHGGTSTLDLNNNGSDTAWLDTTLASVQTSYTSAGKDTHWDIEGFNGGSAPTHSILEVRDTTVGGGGGTTVSGAEFILLAGKTVSHTEMNVISGALAPVTNLTDLANNGTVETAIATNAGLVSDGKGVNGGTTDHEHIYVTIYGAGPSANEAGVYEVVFDATAGHLTNGTTFAGHTNDFSVNLIGIIHNTAQDSLQPVNFH